MLNIVIISKDLDYSRHLINLLSTKNNNLRILGVLTEIDELFDVIKQTTIDIILINYDCIDYKILKDNKTIQPFLKSTILISNNISKDISKNKLNVYAYIKNPKEIETIVSFVNQLATSKIIEKCFYSNHVEKNTLIKAIEAELKYLNVTISYTGVRYLIEAIYVVYTLENYYDFNLEKDVYPIIAQKHHKKISNIKSNITYAVNVLYMECEEEKLLEYLEEYSLRKASPKRIIFAILGNVKKEMHNTNIKML